MQHFLSLENKIDKEKPWLILGKGPSFEEIDSIDLSQFNLFGLNHVAYILPVTIAHFIDLEVNSPQIFKNADYVLIPWHPHINCKVSSKTLNLHLSDHEKIYWYDLSTWKPTLRTKRPTVKGKHLPIIWARFFSAEAAFQILGYLGITKTKIYSLGIDGGTFYAKHFSRLGLKPLTNKRKNFDEQFQQIEKTCKKFELKWIRF